MGYSHLQFQATLLHYFFLQSLHFPLAPDLQLSGCGHHLVLGLHLIQDEHGKQDKEIKLPNFTPKEKKIEKGHLQTVSSLTILLKNIFNLTYIIAYPLNA